MANNPLLAIKECGQSVWLDYIQRDLLKNGELRRLITQDGVCGVTSNPAILEKAIVEHDDYEQAIEGLVREDAEPPQIYETLALQDVRDAADLLQPVYEETEGLDGFVSLEVSPHLAYNTEETVREAKRLWAEFDRPNAMIKVPATREGLPAMRELLTDGVNINATLLFSLQRYREVADTFLAALEERTRADRPVDHLASVASFFVSRIDVLVDKQLDERGRSDPDRRAEAQALRGQAAVASAKVAYQVFKQLFSGERWAVLAAQGAQPQRLLWASTGTKDPSYSDVKYADALIGPQTVNTLPPKTLAAYRDHGRPALRLENQLDKAQTVLDHLAALGIDLAAVTQQLEEEGVEKFIVPFERILDTLKQRIQHLTT